MGPFGAVVANMFQLKSAAVKRGRSSSPTSSVQLGSTRYRPATNGRAHVRRAHTGVQVDQSVRVGLLLLLLLPVLLDVHSQDEVALLVNVVGGGDDAVLADREAHTDASLTAILCCKP